MRNARRARLVIVLLLLAALTLITIDYRSGNAGELRRIGSSVFGPIENGLSSVFRPIGSFFAGLGHVNSYKAENAKLRAEIETERNRLAQEQSDQQAFSQLEKMDGLARKAHYHVVHARVTAVSDGNLGLKWTIALDVGSLDGVRTNMAVMNAAGLVGRTIRVSRTSSTVLLACDKSFKVGVYLQASGHEGLLFGEDQGPMRLELFDPQTELKSGQRLVTIGDDIFPPQLPVGIVDDVEGSTTASGGRIGTVTPFVDFSGLAGSLVSVVVESPRTEPRGILIPSPPPTSTSPTTTNSTSPTTGGTSTKSTGATPPAGQTTSPTQ
ncbi:MAG TPA: rod shape-determining protein MreC [Acidimicrobiales bacterium]|nr:rod shape-determining protein MreC [Acidimicrobiales bacterium]